MAPFGTPLGVLLDLVDRTEGLLSSLVAGPVVTSGMGLGLGTGRGLVSSSECSSSVLSKIESEGNNYHYQ